VVDGALASPGGALHSAKKTRDTSSLACWPHLWRTTRLDGKECIVIPFRWRPPSIRTPRQTVLTLGAKEEGDRRPLDEAEEDATRSVI